jgi:ABC-type glycerol-3-phosphate transport system substrate-binding protein
MKKIMLLLVSMMLCVGACTVAHGQTIQNLKWLDVDKEITELSIGKGVTLSAQTKGISNGEPVTITIWSKGEEDDDLVGRYVSRVEKNKIAFHWILAFELEKLPNSSQREMEEDEYTSPRYYFEIRHNTIESQKSALLAVRVWLKHGFHDGATKEPWRNRGITLFLPDDTRIETRTDTDGRISIDNVKVIGEIAWFIHRDTGEYHEIIQPYREPESPAYYKIKEEDDSLRTIAAYDFIYGNPDSWKILYSANKNNFTDDKNPDSIEAGQALIIPPIGKQKRSGTR